MCKLDPDSLSPLSSSDVCTNSQPKAWPNLHVTKTDYHQVAEEAQNGEIDTHMYATKPDPLVYIG